MQLDSTLTKVAACLPGSILVTVIAPFVTYPHQQSIVGRIIWFNLSLFIASGASFIFSEQMGEAIKGRNWLYKLWRVGTAIRNLLAWSVIPFAITLFVSVNVFRDGYEYRGPAASVWQNKLQDYSLFFTFYLSLLTLTRSQAIFGLSTISLTILMAYGA